jgi:hypothetical protein
MSHARCAGSGSTYFTAITGRYYRRLAALQTLVNNASSPSATITFTSRFCTRMIRLIGSVNKCVRRPLIIAVAPSDMKSQLVFAVHTTLPLPPVQPPRDDRMLRIPPPFSSGIRLTTATHTRTNVCLDAQVGFDARNLTTTSGGT